MDDLQLATRVLAAIRLTACIGPRDDLLDAAIRYAGIRCEWARASVERRAEIDPARTRAHDVLIDAFNILSRETGRAGENNAWRETLGENRRRIGDIACHLHCLIALSAG